MANISSDKMQQILELMEECDVYAVNRINGVLHFSYYKEGETRASISGRYFPEKKGITFYGDCLDD